MDTVHMIGIKKPWNWLLVTLYFKRVTRTNVTPVAKARCKKCK